MDCIKNDEITLDKNKGRVEKILDLRDNLIVHLDKKTAMNLNQLLAKNEFYDTDCERLLLIAKNIICRYSKYFDGKDADHLFRFVSDDEINAVISTFIKQNQ